MFVINTDRELKNMKVIVIQIIFLHIFSSCIFASSCPSKPVYGLCYSPFRAGQKPGESYPTAAQIEEDISIISDKTFAIRTYGIDGNLSVIPELCNTYGIDCYVGAWISGDIIEDQNTISDLIEIADANYATTKGLIVGNEYVFEHFSEPCSGVSYISGLIEQVRDATTGLPVATAEPWDIWYACPNLVDAVDFMPIHHYAFLRHFDISIGAQENIGVYDELKVRYPNKEIMIFETGWPTHGETLVDAVPSEENQKQFLKEFILLAKENNIKYFIFGAFDEPYKIETSGYEYEGHFGLYYEDRTIKPGFAEIVSANNADVNFDGTVNLYDYSYLSKDWQSYRDCEDLCLAGDINHDCNVNLEDLLSIVSDWLLGYE